MNYISLLIQDLEQCIHAAPMNPIHRSELICISNLVFYSGIKKDEIGLLKVRDVIDGSGRARDVVGKFGKRLRLSNEAKMAIEKYYGEMKAKRPWQDYRRKPFFPSYQNSRTLGRHWKDIDTGYNKIRQAGIIHHYMSGRENARSLGALYREGGKLFRITPREYQAIVHEKRIPSGTAKNNERCSHDLFALYEKAESIEAGPTAKSDAEKILKEAQKIVDRIKGVEMRHNYEELISELQTTLSPYL